MNRKELYKQINELGLKEEIKKEYGKNYTQCSNEQLEAVVTSTLNACSEVQDDLYNESVSYKCLSRLVEVLAKKNILLKSEVSYIL